MVSDTTPGGLLSWGQNARYTARDDRQVITALTAGRTGIIRPARFTPGPGAWQLTLEPGWLAVADAGDGTSAVLSADTPAVLAVTPPDGADAVYTAWAVPDLDMGTWTASLLAGPPAGGVALGEVRVPAGAASAAQAHVTARAPDYDVTGPPGPQGPQGPQGPPAPPGPPLPGRLVPADTGAVAWTDPPYTMFSLTTAYSPAAGRFVLWSFRAGTARTVRRVHAAGAGGTGVSLYFGIYRIEADGSNTLLGRTADVGEAVTGATFTLHADLIAPVALEAGRVYRLAMLTVRAVTHPTWLYSGGQNSSAFTNLAVPAGQTEKYPAAFLPVTSHTELPATLARNALGAAPGFAAFTLD